MKEEIPQEYAELSFEEEVERDKKTLEWLRFRYVYDDKFRVRFNKEIAFWKKELKDRNARQRGKPRGASPTHIWVTVNLKRREENTTLDRCFTKVASEYHFSYSKVKAAYYKGVKLLKSNPNMMSLI